MSLPDLDSKEFATTAARYAMAGRQLLRTDPRDGPVRLFAIALDGMRELRSLSDALCCLSGGADDVCG